MCLTNVSVQCIFDSRIFPLYICELPVNEGLDILHCDTWKHSVVSLQILSSASLENLPMLYTESFELQKLKNFQLKSFDIFLIFAQNIDCVLTHTVHMARQIPTGTSNSRCLCQRVRFGG